MEYLNKIEIRGRVGRSEVKHVDSDNVIIKIAVSTKYAYQNQQKEKFIETSWFEVNYCTTANEAAKLSLRLGDIVHLTGRLKIVKYYNGFDDEKMVPVIVVKKLEKLGEASDRIDINPIEKL